MKTSPDWWLLGDKVQDYIQSGREGTNKQTEPPIAPPWTVRASNIHPPRGHPMCWKRGKTKEALEWSAPNPLVHFATHCFGAHPAATAPSPDSDNNYNNTVCGFAIKSIVEWGWRKWEWKNCSRTTQRTRANVQFTCFRVLFCNGDWRQAGGMILR